MSSPAANGNPDSAPGGAGAGPRGGWDVGAGIRVAGLVVALGYLLGFVRGPLIGVVGGLALVTLGRCAFSREPSDLVLGAALAALAVALQAGVVRWGTVDLGELRGVQAVLGPTLLVGPAGAAVACWIAAGAALVALAAWLTAARRGDAAVPPEVARAASAARIAEAAVGGFAVVTVFWGGAVPRGSWTGGEGVLALLQWGAAVALVTGAAAGAARLLDRRPLAWLWAGLSASATAALTAGVVVARVTP